MEDEEDTAGCMSCMDTKELRDLFAVCGGNSASYARMFDSCFDITVPKDLKHICAACAVKLESATAFKDQTNKSMAMLHGIKGEDEEYLDETILEDEEAMGDDDNGSENELDEDDDLADSTETTCVYCSAQFTSSELMNSHIVSGHGLQPREELGQSGEETPRTSRRFPCHFCDKVYSGRKACYTHLRMKHGLKLTSEASPPKQPRRERKFCHICQKDFSQKQVLNKHLWKEHGYEVEKRKAYQCPLCDERVSYGSHFERHLLNAHRLKQRISRLEFRNMDEFLVYKNQIQEETKCRFRKTTASKPTVEGLRSHYMCSQSGVYVYQGKGIRPTPERQIYKTGKACPAHMVVTETVDRVFVTFHTTHVGHGACPYYVPRDQRKPNVKLEPVKTSVAEMKLMAERAAERQAERAAGREKEMGDSVVDIETVDDEDDVKKEEASLLGLICDSCGAGFVDGEQFRAHAAAHGRRLYPCQSCERVFQNVEAWSRHFRSEHNIETLYSSNN